ncbi:hypothetical protein ACIP1U_30785 [Cupriavidus sp. NPDC089707]|uniref:hypothetical protein n=1 Tax=Cupriavidus sp. NPDC089707 TaxID=3363963 RepID=UPI003814707D
MVRDITERIRGRGLTVCQAAILVEASQADLLLALCGKFQAFRAAELRSWLKRLSCPLAAPCDRRRYD